MSATTVTPTAATSPPSARTVQASVPLRDALTQITAMAWRALVKMRRNPEQLVDVTAMPVLFTLMFGFMFARRHLRQPLVGLLMGYRPGGGLPGVTLAILLAVITGWSLAWICT
jgi:hypothetical protein